MIKCLTKSLNTNQESEILYHFNEIKLGSNYLHSDLVIENEKDVAAIHLYIRVKADNSASILSAKDNIAFHLNNKKVIGNVVLRIGDIVQVGQTQIIIRDLSFTHESKMSEKKKNLEEAIIAHSEIGEVLSEIQNEIISCERMINE